MDNKSVHWHPVWQINPKELRQALFQLNFGDGVRILSMRRRKKGSIVADLKRVRLPVTYDYVSKFKHDVETWLEEKFGRQVASKFIVSTGSTYNQGEHTFMLEIYKSDIDPKYGDSHPYL